MGPPVLRVPEPPPATGVVKQGQLLFRVDPGYPTLARNQRVEGTVRLNVTIAADGSVRGVSVLDGPRLLVEAAEKAVLRWRYSPTLPWTASLSKSREKWTSIFILLSPRAKARRFEPLAFPGFFPRVEK